jgi:hypothetical protein
MGRPDGEDNADLSSDDSPWSDTAWSEDDDDEVRHSSHSPVDFDVLSRLFSSTSPSSLSDKPDGFAGLFELLQGSLSLEDSGNEDSGEGSGLESDDGLEEEAEDAEAGGESDSSEDEVIQSLCSALASGLHNSPFLGACSPEVLGKFV